MAAPLRQVWVDVSHRNGLVKSPRYFIYVSIGYVLAHGLDFPMGIKKMYRYAPVISFFLVPIDKYIDGRADDTPDSFLMLLDVWTSVALG